MELTTTVEMIQTFGVLPILCIIIYVLYRQVQKHEQKIEELNKLIIRETKGNADGILHIHENTIKVLNELTEVIRDLSKY